MLPSNLYGACANVKVTIGNVNDEQIFFIQEHSSYPLILGQPYITAVCMETKVLDDGSPYARIRSRDGKSAVQFLTVCVNHARNKDSLRDHPLLRIRKEFEVNRKFNELPKWEKQYITGMQSELQGCNVLDPDDVISGFFEEISYVDMMSELEEIKRNRLHKEQVPGIEVYASDDESDDAQEDAD
ncbi:hypothetical protein L7F22_023304 [Adiantum nelumboides]|nr:hypothetical protein [Adiantum nelumboides]